jgi:hypothetical protein
MSDFEYARRFDPQALRIISQDPKTISSVMCQAWDVTADYMFRPHLISSRTKHWPTIHGGHIRPQC